MKQQIQFEKIIDDICGYIYNRKFKDAEIKTLGLVEAAVKPSVSSKLSTKFVELLYYRFNAYYLTWVKNHGGDEDQEIRELLSSEHHNFLIAHCTEASCMDDMLYELSQLAERKSDLKDLENEVKYHLTCYQKYIN